MASNNDISHSGLDLQALMDASMHPVSAESTSGSAVGIASHDVSTALSVSNPVPADRTLASIEETVNGVWEEVLGRRPIAHDVDYWEIGRGTKVAIRLLEQIGKKTGVELPLTVLYESPTIASLARAVYDGKTSTSTFSLLVKLKAGAADKPPLFIVSGLGGLVIELFATARAITYGGAIYAIQPKGLNENDAPHNSIDEMATDYVKAIREVQPHGPYLISGYSVGGYVAIEMARQLEAQGEPVPFLGLLDSHPFEGIWPFRVWLSFMIEYSSGTLWRRFRKYVGNKWKAAPATARSAAQENAYSPERSNQPPSSGSSMQSNPTTSQAKRFLQNIQRYTLRFENPRGRDFPARFTCYTTGLPPGPQQVLENGLRVIAEYRPRPFDKEIFFFKSELGDSAQCDPLKVWPKYFPRLNIRMVPGDHRSMLYGPNAAGLAREISSCLALLP